MRPFLAALFFTLTVLMVTPAQATEPAMADRHGPGAHFLDDPPLSKSGRRVRRPQTHERAAAFVGNAIAQPSRYIAGRLICALNVNAALAEHGIKGPGGANSKAFRSWGHASGPKPLAVAFNYRRGGGHVSIVSHVDAQGRVWVWNPSPRGRGWQLRVNRYSSVYRAAS